MNRQTALRTDTNNTANTNNFTIRPFEPTDAEYKAIVKIENQAYSDEPSSAESYKYYDSICNPKFFYQRFVGEIEYKNGKRIVASSSISHKNYFHFLIDKEFEDHGLHEPIYNYLVKALAEKNVSKLSTGTLEDNRLLIDFLQQKGFQQKERYPNSELGIPSFDFTPYVGFSEKVIASGIAIFTVQELQKRDSNCLQKLYDLKNAILKSMPDMDEFTPAGLDDFAKTFERPHNRTDAWFVAVDGEDYVGLSSFFLDLDHKDILCVGLTGVLPSHRRRGIATAIKLRTIAFAKTYGAKSIKTGNAEDIPMYGINLKLGFKPTSAWLSFEKAL